MIDKRKQIGHTHRTDLLQLMLESASDEDFIQVRFSFDCQINCICLYFYTGSSNIVRKNMKILKLKHH